MQQNVKKENIESENILITPKTRKINNREMIMFAFDEITTILDTEIHNIRNGSIEKTNCIKLLCSLNKNIKALKLKCSRVIKQKSTTPLVSNKKSGFQKPVKISSDLAKFAGWPSDELRSRVEVTKYICDYIASNKLQNPEDKRQIWPDSKLQKLLGINSDKSDKPLYYYGIQTYLKNQNHFPKDIK